MNEGVWRLRCQNCGATFSVELTAKDNIADFVRAEICPMCGESPDGKGPDGGPAAWHQVMDYKNPSKMPKYSAGSATQAAPDSEAPSAQEIFKLRLS
ncbi:MAG TPA: hypothetical protein VL754_14445 [Verrucomicrobiae bacterium]|nr:hypothetical protein [Verrucomicrobiae bacterium]